MSQGAGFGGLALAAMMHETVAASDGPLAPKAGHHPAKAKAVIQIFCPGGLSHVDSWDYKPELSARNGKPFDLDGKLQFFASKPGNCQGSYWQFRQRGECGKWMSDLFPKLGDCVDDIAFIHSMQSKSALHGPAMFMGNTGFILPGFPSMGAWITYGLGSESEDLPSYVVLPDPRGLPPGGVINWGAGFLPAMYQGTPLETDANKPPIANLFPPDSFASLCQPSEKDGRAFLEMMNQAHEERHDGYSELDARIQAYEMAARLQVSAPEATDINGESELSKTMYQLDHKDIGPFGRQCMLARRLVERGVRFVQIYCGAENTTAKAIRPNWDSHEDIVRDHGYWGPILDSGAAALLKDLKSRGMLDSTLVICTTEFGRQPAAQGNGRDHNPSAFTAWMAGGGIKGGVSYGATDELGSAAIENPSYCYDLHATALHLLGLDHQKLTFYNNGVNRRLTDVHGSVLNELIG